MELYDHFQHRLHNPNGPKQEDGSPSPGPSPRGHPRVSDASYPKSVSPGGTRRLQSLQDINNNNRRVPEPWHRPPTVSAPPSDDVVIDLTTSDEDIPNPPLPQSSSEPPTDTQTPVAVVDDAETDISDDDLMEVDPQEATKLTVFKQSRGWRPHNQPAPVPHFSPEIPQTNHHLQLVRAEHDTATRRYIMAQGRLRRSVQQLKDNQSIYDRDPSAADNPTQMEAAVAAARAGLSEVAQAKRRLSLEITGLEEKLQSLVRQTGNYSLPAEAYQLPQAVPPAEVLDRAPDPEDVITMQQYTEMIHPPEASNSSTGFPTYYLAQEDEGAHIQSLLENIRPDEEEEEGLPLTPDELRINLFKHQRVGLAWLMRMELSKSQGGILADDMGLGKTIQSIALMMAHKSKDPNHKTTLIVAPVSLLRQWANEIEIHTKVDVSVGVYHGSSKNKLFKTFKDFQRYDVILTSYSTLAIEFKRHYKELFEMNHTNMTQNMIPPHGAGGGVYASPFYTSDAVFYRVILDEAQNIKNKLTVSSKAVTVLSATYRFCLTGTPMQNSIDELYPIIRFLRIKPYAKETVFKHRVSNPLKKKDKDEIESSMRSLRALLRAILLRRSKTSKIDGKPILELPPKTVEDIEVKMDPVEFETYESIESQLKTRAKRLFMEDKNFSNFLVLLLRLRQASCHTFLCELGSSGKLEQYRYRNWPSLLKTVEQLDSSNKQFIIDELGTIDKDDDSKNQTPKPESMDNELINFSQLSSQTSSIKEEGGSNQGVLFANNEEKPLIDVIDGGEYETNQGMVYVSNEDKPSMDMILQDDGENDNGVFTCPLCFISYTFQSAIMFPCKHKICEDCIDSFIEDNRQDEQNKVKCSECSVAFKTSEFIDYRMFYMRYIEQKSRYDIQCIIEDSFKGKLVVQEKIKKLIVKHQGFTYSTKMEEILRVVTSIFENYPGEKIIVFSSFTTFFDLLKIMFSKAGIPFLRYDGTMSIEKKDLTIKEFYQNHRYKVMLTSLKAGNVGLTLNCASHVIISDPFWNPYVEEQAMDRAHRIGQTRDVHVYRILIQGTVEERIIALQNKKKELINAALDENGMKSVSRLSRRDLGFLFGFNTLS